LVGVGGFELPAALHDPLDDGVALALAQIVEGGHGLTRELLAVDGGLDVLVADDVVGVP
jgi:hypothetical protein